MATPTIERYLNVQQAYMPSFSADGQWVRYLHNMTGMMQVWQVPAGSTKPAWPQQLTFETDRVMGCISSPTDSDVIYYARDVGGNENAQLFALNLATSVITPLTAGREDAMHTPLRVTDDGQTLYFSANRLHRARFDLFKLDLASGDIELVWQNDGAGYLWQLAIAPQQERLVITRMKSSPDHDLIEVDLATNQARIMWEVNGPTRFGSPAFSPDGQSLFVLTDHDADFPHLRRFDVAEQTSEAVLQSEWGVETFTVDPTGRLAAVIVNRDGIGELSLIDLTDGTREVLPAPDNAPGIAAWLERRVSWSPDGEQVCFSYISAVSGSNIYCYDRIEKQLTQLTNVSMGGLVRDQFATPKLVHYPTFDEREIPAWYYPPAASDGPAPTVVIVHGGPEGQSRPNFNFMAQYMHRAGFAVLLPNVRGSVGYGKTYADLDNVEKRMDSVADLAYAAHWLKERPELDPDRIAVYGGSYGGFMVLAALTHHPDLWAAGVNIVGISNFVTFLENTSDYRRAHREAEYGSLAHDREFMESIAPINHLDKMTAPLLVIHGANDPRVPLSEAEQLVAALKQREHPVELLVFDDEGHGIAKLKNKLVAYPRVVEFLQQHT